MPGSAGSARTAGAAIQTETEGPSRVPSRFAGGIPFEGGQYLIEAGEQPQPVLRRRSTRRLPETAYGQTLALRRASELLAEVLRDAQRRLALEAASVAAPPVKRGRQVRAQPMPYVDLSVYDGMADRDVLIALGARKDEVKRYKAALQHERSGLYSLHGDESGRCQAGLVTQLSLRCRRTALAGEQWCRQHHPDPPDLQSAAERRRLRLRREELWLRPDGRALEALYDLTDSVQELVDAWRDIADVADRVHRLEAEVAGRQASARLDRSGAAAPTSPHRGAATRAAKMKRTRLGPETLTRGSRLFQHSSARASGLAVLRDCPQCARW